jgi:hypothetical protein
MLKFYIVKESYSGVKTHEIKEFKTLKEFWNYTGKNHIVEIKTLESEKDWAKFWEENEKKKEGAK